MVKIGAVFGLAVAIVTLSSPCLGGKKKEKAMFSSAALKCLVCDSLMDELIAEIAKVDPKKMVNTGTFRIDSKGEQKQSIIPYSRSQVHLMELLDRVCKNFEDYAQAKEKATGKAAVIRLTTHTGNMNPRFGEYDIVPDDDLNTKLKFYCESIVEDTEEALLQLLAEEDHPDLKQEVCRRRAKICKTKSPAKKKETEIKQEL